MSDTSHLRSVLVMGASVIALAALAAPAMAQTAAAAPAAPAPAEPAADTTGGGADVIVTAEHRQTRLQKVPVAVSVFTGASRDRVGIASVQDVTNFTPGFSYDTVTVNAGMRGVTRQSFNVTDDSRVTAYEDEFFVYSPYNLSLSSLFFSQEQIERGPQNVGGRNSEGGSIDMIAVRPTDHPYGEIRAQVGNFQSYEVEGAASNEILPGLTARIAGNYDTQGQGYFKNLAGGSSEFNKHTQWHIEGSADWKVTPDFDIYARAEAGAWEKDEGLAGTRQFLSRGSWDEVNNIDPNVGAADGSLFFNPNFGYAAVTPGAAAGANAVAAAQFAGGGFPQELPIATTLKNPNIFNNPSINRNDAFSAVQPRTASLRNFDDLNYIMTYHLPSADIKYTGGFQGYDYTLDFADVDSDVLNYTLPGSAFGEQAAAVAGLGALGIPPVAFTGIPAPSTLTIFPTDHIHFVENDWWTSHELSIQSTDSGPLQYIVGVHYYFQQYSQPTFITTNQPQLAHPLSVAALANPTIAFLPSIVLNPANLAAPNPTNEILENNYQIEDQSVGGYAQLSYKFTDTLKFTGNIRVSNDRKYGNEEDRTIAFGGSTLASLYNILIPLYGAATPSFDLTPAVVCLSGNNTTATSCNTGPLARGVKALGTIRANGVANRQLDASDTEVTGGAGLEWTPTNDIFVYARYARGYAPLSFNSGFVSASPEVTPEFLNSYEVGYKQSFGRTFSIDAAAYYYDYDQIQLPITVSVGGVLEGQFINYPKAESTGVELEANWNPTRDLIFTLSYSFDYTALLTGCSGHINANGSLTPTGNSVCLVNTQDPLGTGPGAHIAPGQFLSATNTALVQSVKGAPLPNAPRNKVAVTGAYTFHFDPGNLTLAATYVWRDKQIGNTVFNTPYNTAPSWDDVDLRATWSGDHDRYEVIAFAKNLFNTLQYPTGAGGAGLIGNATTATSNAALFYDTTYNLNPPRTFGVEVRYKFF